MEPGSNDDLAWGCDNIAYEPVELPTLANWIKLGRAFSGSRGFKERERTWHRAGDIGEPAVVGQGPRSAEVIAHLDSVLVKVSSNALMKRLTDATALAAPFTLALTRVIAERVRAITKRYDYTIHLSRAAGLN